MRLVGADGTARLSGAGQYAGTANYFIGHPDGWRTGVPAFEKVRYQDLYPGVDAVFYGNQRELEYDFVFIRSPPFESRLTAVSH